MNFRLKMSKTTTEILKNLQSSTGLTPNVLARLSVGLSLRDSNIPEMKPKDTAGQEINRNTLTGEYDYIYRALITQHTGREVKDEEYFPELFQAHLERGASLLNREYRKAGNRERFFTQLLLLSEE